jgi:hypothetical protein
VASSFKASPNVTSGDTQASGSLHQFTGSVSVTGSLTLNGVAVSTGGGGGGSGDVSGPGSATDNAIARFNGAGGKTIQNSSVTIDDSNNLGNATTLSASDGMSAGAVVTDGLATLAAVKVTAGPIWFHTGATHQIQNSNGDSNITLDTGDGDVTIGGDLQVNGNDIKDSGGNAQFTFENGVGFTAGKGTFMGGIVSPAGINPQGTGADSIQVGSNNGAVAIGSLNISFGGTVSGQGSQAIGPGSPVANQAGASAIGSGSHSTATNALAVGTTSVASAAAAVALGSSATGSAANAIAVGTTTKATAAGATALGNAATSSAAGAIAIGSGATTAGAYSVVLGDTITNVTHNHTTVIGTRAGAGGASAVAIGSGSNAGGTNAIAIGESAAPSAADAISIGKSAISSATGSIVVGAGASSTGQQAVTLGNFNNSTANYTTIVGYNNNASVNYSVVIGDTSYAHGANALAIGQNVYAEGADSIAIGQNATASATNTMAFGSGSNASEANTVVFGNSTQPVRMFVSGAVAQTYFSASISVHTAATCSFYNIFNYHLGGTLTLTAQDQVAGASYLFFLRQDGNGSRAVTFSGFKWPGGSAPTLSTAANAVDMISGISDGTSIYADVTKNFS